jgi:hypothetical protein
MSTVIFRYLTRDGFVIVADGKSHFLGKEEPGEINVQKIFQIQENRRPMRSSALFASTITLESSTP